MYFLMKCLLTLVIVMTNIEIVSQQIIFLVQLFNYWIYIIKVRKLFLYF